MGAKVGEVNLRDQIDHIAIIKLVLKQLGAPLERNMYMEVPCQQMCNGHEHVCLRVDMISVVGFWFFGMEMTMTDTLGWNRWWLQK